MTSQPTLATGVAARNGAAKAASEIAARHEIAEQDDMTDSTALETLAMDKNESRAELPGRPPRVHPLAFVDKGAELENDVEIGPFCVVEKNTFIGAGTVLHAQAIVMQYSRIGRECQIFGGAKIGGPPQDTKFQGERSYVELGDRNIVREEVTIHRATGENNCTRLGNHNMLMAYAHVGHNCEIGSHITVASYVGISGHVTIEDYANLGGICGVHQFCRIGTLAMVGGMSGISQDIPPFTLAQGRPARVYDVNKIGLRRANITPKVRGELRQAIKLLYRSDLNISQALEEIEATLDTSPELEHLINFIRKTRSGTNGRGNT